MFDIKTLSFRGGLAQLLDWLGPSCAAQPTIVHPHQNAACSDCYLNTRPNPISWTTGIHPLTQKSHLKIHMGPFTSVLGET